MNKSRINNKSIKGKLLKTYFYFFYSLHQTTYIQIIDIVDKYVYKNIYIHADIYFTAYSYKNTESTILNQGIMRK